MDLSGRAMAPQHFCVHTDFRLTYGDLPALLQQKNVNPTMAQVRPDRVRDAARRPTLALLSLLRFPVETEKGEIVIAKKGGTPGKGTLPIV